MQGKRIESPFAADGRLVAEWPEPGDYWHDARIGWCARTPDGLDANLSAHQVTEHADGTISVLPSILVTAHDGTYHGYLEHGAWRAC